MATPALVQTGRTIHSPAATCRPLRTHPAAPGPGMGCPGHEQCPSVSRRRLSSWCAHTIPVGIAREILVCPTGVPLKFQAGVPVPASTQSTRAGGGATAAAQPGTCCDPTCSQHLLQGRAAAACAGSSFLREQVTLGCASPPSALARCGGRHGRRGGPACPAGVGASRRVPRAANSPEQPQQL